MENKQTHTRAVSTILRIKIILTFTRVLFFFFVSSEFNQQVIVVVHVTRNTIIILYNLPIVLPTIICNIVYSRRSEIVTCLFSRFVKISEKLGFLYVLWNIHVFYSLKFPLFYVILLKKKVWSKKEQHLYYW